MLPEALHTSVCCAACIKGAATAAPSAMHHQSNIQRAKARERRKVCSNCISAIMAEGLLSSNHAELVSPRLPRD